MDTDAYEGREQSLAKHEILKRYLETLAFKIGQANQFRPELTFNYVDGFSGPWESKTDDLSDTSPSLALQRLSAVQNDLRASGRKFTVRAFFVSLDKRGAESLGRLRDIFPGAEIEIVTGEFEAHIDAARRFVRVGRDPFAFLFIDPTGWTGFGLKAITPLLREGRGEVLLNFMTSKIHRFVETGQQHLIPSFVDLFGDATYRDAWRDLDGPKREERMVDTYCARLKQAGGYLHCVSAVILNPTSDRTHYHLIYGTRSDEGLVVFRDVERKGIETQRKLRAEAKQRGRVSRSGQGELFDGAVLVTRSYEDELRERYLPRAIQRLDEMIGAGGEVAWDELVRRALQVPLVSEADVKEWLKEQRARGDVEVLGLEPSERVPKRRHNHRVRRVT